MGQSCYFCRLFVMLLCASVYCDLLAPFVMSNCKFVTFPLISWVGYGT